MPRAGAAVMVQQLQYHSVSKGITDLVLSNANCDAHSIGSIILVVGMETVIPRHALSWTTVDIKPHCGCSCATRIGCLTSFLQYYTPLPTVSDTHFSYAARFPVFSLSLLTPLFLY
jgi:hypothetical protein